MLPQWLAGTRGGQGVLRCGEKRVTITPSGKAGSVVRGTLYVDALAGGLLPIGQVSGVELAALPYEYTIG
jgi:hypothetical protein